VSPQNDTALACYNFEALHQPILIIFGSIMLLRKQTLNLTQMVYSCQKLSKSVDVARPTGSYSMSKQCCFCYRHHRIIRNSSSVLAQFSSIAVWFLPRVTMLARYICCRCVTGSPSVRLSQAGTLPKRLNIVSRIQQRTIAQGL